MIELHIPPLILQQALQLVTLHFRYTVLHTNTIVAKLHNLRCKFRCSNAQPQHTLKTELLRYIPHSWFPAPTLVLPPYLAQSHWKDSRIKESPTPHSFNNCERQVAAPNPIKIPTITSTPLLQRLFKTICSLPSPLSVSRTTYTNSPHTSQCVRTVTLCLSSDFSPKVINPFPPTCSL